MRRSAGQRAARGSPAPRRAGFTLVELMISMAVGSLLMVGLASALYVAGRIASVPLSSDAVVGAAQAACNLTDELQYAIYILDRQSTAIEFAVADADGDGQPDVIRYEWSGAPGDPLLRTFNRGDPVEVVDNVQELAFEYDVREQPEEIDVLEESAEQTLAGWSGSASLSDESIKDDKWRGEYFKPVLPADAVAWKVTKVKFKAKTGGPVKGETLVQLRPATGDNTPTSTVIDEVSLLETSLSGTYQWEEFAFSNVSGLSPSDGLCLVLQHVSDAESCKVQYQNAGVTLPDSGWLKSSDQGSSWTNTADAALLFEAYGTYTAPAPPVVVARQYLTGVGISILAGDGGPASRIQTRAQLANSPELLSAFWSLDFDRDPTAADVNFDGDGDWVRRDNQPFDTGSLASGVWSADSTLDTFPDHDFTAVTTAEVRARNTSIGGDGAVLQINADWSAGRFAPLFALLQLQADGTQTLTVRQEPGNPSDQPLVVVAGLSSDFQLVRLVILPAQDLVNVKVNGADAGTYSYNTFAPVNTDRFVSLFASGGDAQFDYVSVRVSE